MSITDKTCFLITGNYPFCSGESFLETEIEYLATRFRLIVIFAIGVPPGERATRRLPNNARAYAIGGVATRLRYPVYIFKGLFAQVDGVPLEHSSIPAIASSLYARGRVSNVFRTACRIIEGEYLANTEQAVYYSYWFTDHAILAWLLKERYSAESQGVAVSRAHGYDLYWERNALGYLPYQSLMLSNLEGVFCCSDHGRNYLEQKYPGYVEKIGIARLGTRDYGVRSGTLKSNGAITFVTCSALTPVKRVTVFAQAFCELCNHYPECIWVCIGDGPERASIERILRLNSRIENATFIGSVSNEEVIDFYKNNAVSYFCNVSQSEGVPVSIMEAMSFGIPVIATDVGGTSELVSFDNGFLLSGDFSEPLYLMLVKALSISEDEYQGLRRMSRCKWEELSNAETNYSAWSDMLALNTNRSDEFAGAYGPNCDDDLRNE